MTSGRLCSNRKNLPTTTGSSEYGNAHAAIAPEVKPTVAVSKTVRADCSSNRRNKTRSYGGNSLVGVVAAASGHDSSVFLHSVDST